MRKGCRGHFQIAILPQFLTFEPHFVRKSCRGHFKIAILPQFLTIELIEPHSRETVALRKKRKRRRETVTEGKREREKGRERERRCEDVRMWRWYVCRCEDEQMWRCEDVEQTPTIRRTLRSDALRKEQLASSRQRCQHLAACCCSSDLTKACNCLIAYPWDPWLMIHDDSLDHLPFLES